MKKLFQAIVLTLMFAFSNLAFASESGNKSVQGTELKLTENSIRDVNTQMKNDDIIIILIDKDGDGKTDVVIIIYN